jgi:hypothetical protein
MMYGEIANLKMINKEIFKIMWLPGEDEIIFRAKDESPLSLNTDLYRQLIKYFDIDKWKSKYNIAYKEWLNNNSNVVDRKIPIQIVLNWRKSDMFRKRRLPPHALPYLFPVLFTPGT